MDTTLGVLGAHTIIRTHTNTTASFSLPYDFPIFHLDPFSWCDDVNICAHSHPVSVYLYVVVRICVDGVSYVRTYILEHQFMNVYRMCVLFCSTLCFCCLCVSAHCIVRGIFYNFEWQTIWVFICNIDIYLTMMTSGSRQRTYSPCSFNNVSIRKLEFIMFFSSSCTSSDHVSFT